ncbi:MAG: tetratricopeptide repeat protein [Bacteroidota bacterium]
MSTNRIVLLEGFIADDPTDPFNYYALALEFIKSGQNQNAQVQFQFLIDNHPDYLPTFYHFGKLLEEQGHIHRALEVYQAGILLARKQQNKKTESELQGALDFIQ